ncbi:MAG: DNA-binding protein [Scytolyngbya sp. HA4215-MV1]|nr:DNA-binding protein [Scytolyngbya sp. HA4215-MV1]
MKTFALRLNPGEDLKNCLLEFTVQHQIQAGFILTTVGSLQQAAIRFAAQPQSQILTGRFEIVSLVGTLSRDGAHLHIAISDQRGTTIGGHVDLGCIIYTTAEIVVGQSRDYQFSRSLDEQTGYWELQIGMKDGEQGDGAEE